MSKNCVSQAARDLIADAIEYGHATGGVQGYPQGWEFRNGSADDSLFFERIMAFEAIGSPTAKDNYK